MYHSSSNLLGIKLKAYKPYIYTGFKMRYMAVGELWKITERNCYSVNKCNHKEDKNDLRNLVSANSKFRKFV